MNTQVHVQTRCATPGLQNPWKHEVCRELHGAFQERCNNPSNSAAPTQIWRKHSKRTTGATGNH
eukprot:12091997-Alexandrium_andersonii.AAC.1